MRKAITWIIAVAVLAGVVGGGLWYRDRQQQAAQQVVDILRTGEVVQDDLEITISSSGNVVVERRVDLAFETSGTVRTVNVEVGDRVKTGDLLSELEDDTLIDAVKQAELELAQVQLNLQQAREPADEADIRLVELAIREAVQAMEVADTSAALAQVRAAIDQTRAQEFEKDAREAYETYTDILDDYGLPLAYAAGITAMYMEAEGNVGITQLRSEVAIQQAQSQWLSANQRYAKATRDLALLQQGADENQIQSLELQVELADLSLEQAHADLASARLVAPFDGIIAAVNLQPGSAPPNPARPGDGPALTLLDDTTVYVDLTIDEIDIGAIFEGQPVVLTLDAYPDVMLSGVIERLSALSKISGGVIAYTVRARLSETGSVAIRDGMTAGARITTAVLEDVVLIPNWAIRTDLTTDEILTYCYCLDTGELIRRPIELGARGEARSQVLSGIEAGSSVALVSESVSLFDLQPQGPPPGALRP
ncbi:MAG: HlyD family secretion protein [Anaerolineae bacterium]|nr:HlyD family secretion protein [Anaerolineae bacterium]